MNYSRRQLYALGEPIGESVTRLKPGGRVYGGGGGGSKTPEKTTQVTELPEWAKPYAKDALERGRALSNTPYQAYTGDRIAGFSPLQEQAQKAAAGLDAGPEGFQKQIGGYMSPYMQNVVDIQKREAGRQSGILGQQIAAKAVQSGAFGGSRQALQTAERDRNLAEQMGDIQARGSQAAYESAANQFRQGIGQQQNVIGMQNQLGGQQQALRQQGLTNAYQDFMAEKQAPYTQLGYYSDMIRGLPVGQQSTRSVYDPGPGFGQTAMGIGMGAYGLSKTGIFGAEGGLMESYADGGEIKTYAGDQGSVTSEYNIADIIDKLSPAQLQQARESALNRRDVRTVEMIDSEMAERASIRSGLGGAFNQIPEDRQEQMMAGGGVIAFAPGGVTYEKQFLSSFNDLKSLANDVPSVQTAEQYEEGITKRLPALEKLYGPDITKGYLEETKAKRAELPKQMEKDTGLAIAMAGAKMLSAKGTNQRNRFFQGIADAGESFVNEVGRLKKDQREADDKLRQSEILLATAQQSRKEGLVNKAAAQEDRSQDLARDAYKTKVSIAKDSSQLLSGLAQAEMQGKTQKDIAGMNAKVQREIMNKPGEFERMVSEVDAIRTGKKSFQGKTGEEGVKIYQDTLAQVGAARYGAKYTGPDKTFENDAKFQKDLSERTKMLTLQKSMPGKTPEELAELDAKIEAERQKLIEEYRQTRASGITSKAAPGTPAPGKSVADVGRTPDAEAVNMLKSNPSAQNRKYFDDVFGVGAAARVLGN